MQNPSQKLASFRSFLPFELNYRTSCFIPCHFRRDYVFFAQRTGTVYKLFECMFLPPSWNVCACHKAVSCWKKCTAVSSLSQSSSKWVTQRTKVKFSPEGSERIQISSSIIIILDAIIVDRLALRCRRKLM